MAANILLCKFFSGAEQQDHDKLLYEQIMFCIF